MTRVSIRDVAAETGYSPATVSNVLNEKGNVGAKATNIILEAIARLGYSRSTQISRIIFAIARVNGRIVDESTFQAGVYTGIERAARRLGLPSAMVTTPLPAEKTLQSWNKTRELASFFSPPRLSPTISFPCWRNSACRW